MLYSKVPKGMMARSSLCDLDFISEMSGNWFALLLVNDWVYVPAPKIWMRDQGKMQLFWPEHANFPQAWFPSRKPYFSIFVRAGFFNRLRVTDLELPTTPLSVLTLPEHIARHPTHGPCQEDAGAERLAAQLGTVTLDGPAGAGVSDGITERLATMDIEPASVDRPRPALGPIDP